MNVRTYCRREYLHSLWSLPSLNPIWHLTLFFFECKFHIHRLLISIDVCVNPVRFFPRWWQCVVTWLRKGIVLWTAIWCENVVTDVNLLYSIVAIVGNRVIFIWALIVQWVDWSCGWNCKDMLNNHESRLTTIGVDFGEPGHVPPPNNWETPLHLSRHTTFCPNMLFCPLNIFDKSTPCLQWLFSPHWHVSTLAHNTAVKIPYNSIISPLLINNGIQVVLNLHKDLQQGWFLKDKRCYNVTTNLHVGRLAWFERRFPSPELFFLLM